MNEIDLGEARALLDVNVATGEARWKPRVPSQFAEASASGGAAGNCMRWNKRYAGTLAGYVYPGKGYRMISLAGKRLLAHRLVWAIATGQWPTLHIDHVNGNRSDNRITNLREVSVMENARNRAMLPKNKTGRIGVKWSVRGNRFHAFIKVNGKGIHLGSFVNFSEACAARAGAERALGFHKNHGRSHTFPAPAQQRGKRADRSDIAVQADRTRGGSFPTGAPGYHARRGNRAAQSIPAETPKVEGAIAATASMSLASLKSPSPISSLAMTACSSSGRRRTKAL